MNNDVAASVFRRLISAQLLRRVAAQLDTPDAELRAELAAAQLVGIAMLRYVIKVEPWPRRTRNRSSRGWPR